MGSFITTTTKMNKAGSRFDARRGRFGSIRVVFMDPNSETVWELVIEGI